MSLHVIVGAGAVGAATALLLTERGDQVKIVTEVEAALNIPPLNGSLPMSPTPNSSPPSPTARLPYTTAPTLPTAAG